MNFKNNLSATIFASFLLFDFFMLNLCINGGSKDKNEIKDKRFFQNHLCSTCQTYDTQLKLVQMQLDIQTTRLTMCQERQERGKEQLKQLFEIRNKAATRAIKRFSDLDYLSRQSGKRKESKHQPKSSSISV